MQIQFELFMRQLHDQFPDARVKVDSFPSGAQSLSFVWRGRLWVLDYLPSQAGFGVDEVGESEGFDCGYRHVFRKFELAQQKLLELLSVCPDESLVTAQTATRRFIAN